MPRLDPQQRRAQATVEVDLGGGVTVLCRRRSLLALASSGVLPMHLLRVADNIANEYGDMSPDQIATAVTDDVAEDAHLLRKRVICAAAIEPIITMEPDDHPAHLYVEDLEFDEQIIIFNAITSTPPLTAPPAIPEIPDLSTEVAQDAFRAEAAAAPDLAAPIGKDVPPPAQRVADGGVAPAVARKRRRVPIRRRSTRHARR